LHGLDQFVIVDAAVVRAGDGAQFDTAVIGFQRLDLLRPTGRQAILQVDRGERRGKLAQIGCRRADQARELAEAPMGRGDGRIRAWQDQRQPFRVATVRLDMDERAFHHAGPAAIGAITDGPR
jgi:hypothetical protein